MRNRGVQLAVCVLLAWLSISVLAQQKPSAPDPTNHNSANSDKAGQQSKDTKHDSDISKTGRTGLTDTQSPPAGGEQTTSPTPTTQAAAGPAAWLNNQIMLVAVAAVILLGLALHVVHLFAAARLRHELQRLQNNLQIIALEGDEARASQNAEAERLAEQMSQHEQSLRQLSAQLEYVDHHLAANEGATAKAEQAVAWVAEWIGQCQIAQAEQRAAAQHDEADRAAAIKLLEQDRDILCVNASRVQPLTQAVSAFIENLEGRFDLPAELRSRARSLHRDLRQFDLWSAEASERLASLRRDSFPERSAAFKSEQQRLAEQFNLGQISVAEYVETYHVLLDRYFPSGAMDGDGTPTLAPDEAEFKKTIAGVPDHLMNWFDNLFQLYSQVTAAQPAHPSVDAETASGLVHILHLAREVLGKFDIQPEEIQVGETCYDRRLHDAALVTPASQFPANTVIGVHQCGFRRMSTGEVLRRPKVVVAGAAAV